MKKKKKKELDFELDLSDIKQNDLDDTASFTDLMSRKEKKERKKFKKMEIENDLDSTLEIKEDENNETVEFRTDELSSQISESKTLDLSDIKDNIEKIDLNDNEYKLKNETNNNSKEKKESTNIVNTIFISFGIIGAIAYLIYSILYTNLQNNKNYLLINGCLIIILIFNYCLMTISGKKSAKTLAVINYLLLIAYIALNSLIYLKLI